MLGIHVSERTAEGWFGQGKASAIASVVIIVVLLILIALGIFIINQPAAPWVPATPAAPAAPAAPAPAQPSPTITNEIVPSGVVVLTVEELVNQIIQNPNKYKEGTVMQLTGIVSGYMVGKDDLFLGPAVQGWSIYVVYKLPSNILDAAMTAQVKHTTITIRGTLWHIYRNSKRIELHDGILVTDAK